MHGSELSLGIVFLAGMVSFLSPCVLPIIPAYLTLISGLSFEQLSEAESVRKVRWRLFASALAFVFGFGVVTILVLGGFASLITELGEAWRTGFRWFGGVLLLVFALHMLGIFRINALFKERRFHLTDNKFGIAGAALIGAAFGFGWSPCIGPILAGVLGMAATAASHAQVWTLLATYTLGLAVPFVLAAVFVNLFLKSMHKITRHMRKIEITAGVLLLFMGILLVTNQLTVISERGGFLLDLSQRLEGLFQ